MEDDIVVLYSWKSCGISFLSEHLKNLVTLDLSVDGIESSNDGVLTLLIAFLVHDL